MDLQGKVGEIKGIIEIKRAATGKVERYDFVGKVDDGCIRFGHRFNKWTNGCSRRYGCGHVFIVPSFIGLIGGKRGYI